MTKMMLKEAIALASKEAIAHGKRDAESADPVTAASGRAAVAMLPAFFGWFETEIMASDPQTTTMALSHILGTMAANVAAAAVQDDEHLNTWLKQFGVLVAGVALDQIKHDHDFIEAQT